MNLPSDLIRKIFKEYIYPSVMYELHQYHHSQRFKRVLREFLEECFIDEYVVHNDGVFVRPEPGWFSLSRGSYMIRMDPTDSSRLQRYDRDFFFEIIPTKETQQLIDHIRRRGRHDLSNTLFQTKKYYDVCITAMSREYRRTFEERQVSTRIFTFEKGEPEICHPENNSIKLPKRWFDTFMFYMNETVRLDGI